MGAADVHLPYVVRQLPNNDGDDDPWYIFVSMQDRGFCLRDGMRDMLPPRSIVVHSFGWQKFPSLKMSTQRQGVTDRILTSSSLRADTHTKRRSTRTTSMLPRKPVLCFSLAVASETNPIARVKIYCRTD